MSREFGSYNTGYFHNQMEYAADDLAEGRLQITRVWAEFFRVFSHIAWDISSAEACDSHPAEPIISTIQRMQELEKALHSVKDFVEPYRQVAEFAIKQKDK